ncbi:MAG TPA: SCP2 sterol-binding domain-containing protein [Thiobacillaceae bacterium]|nr:SCP2 sterol-binding domain-containing protein [Thiobacillaceae bacterium]HNA82665.1 SCP2 sterol-binding domain-containing protein [Thiobacillaceae bacterium]HNF88598.1 SCP2 sterol-binding domain-containing protein [Thiobacillaceae bacterium]HNH89885.1 SCP2 sterol-binding domain-containing protein [Thiobacillaceae bacterium]HNI07747.1 SCP2 sterol-binding domain-containing protein [Thiobacillaceae bacterium]
MQIRIITLAAAGLVSLSTQAAPLMSADWATQACQAWNNNPALTDELAEKWIKNDKGRGYKIIHMYRSDCGDATKVEMTISAKNGKALCTYAGKIQHASLDSDVDYEMNAETKRWREMGAGEYGPMRAMMFGRLKFEGPKAEAMRVMGPFEQFLLIPGKVPGEDACPAK